MNKNLANLLKVALPLVLAAVAYILQVDPLSLCKQSTQTPTTSEGSGRSILSLGNLPTVTVNPQQLDAGTN